MLRKKKTAILFATLSLVFASLACTMNIGGPDYPERVIPVSQEAIDSIQSQFKIALEAGISGENIILTLTEPQITSFLAFKLESQKNPLFTKPQVFLQNGQMQIYGQATQGYFVANINVMVNIGIDEEGQPDIQIASADFGPFPVPESLASALSAIIKEAFTGAIGPVATGFRIEKIGIRDGLMVMAGKAK